MLACVFCEVMNRVFHCGLCARLSVRVCWCQVLHSFVIDVVKARLGNVLEAKQLLDLLSRVASVCEVFGTKGRKYIDQERFMTLMMLERPLPDTEARPLFTVFPTSVSVRARTLSPSTERIASLAVPVRLDLPLGAVASEYSFQPRLASVCRIHWQSALNSRVGFSFQCAVVVSVL
jgi:hypothetical protein